MKGAGGRAPIGSGGGAKRKAAGSTDDNPAEAAGTWLEALLAMRSATGPDGPLPVSTAWSNKGAGIEVIKP